MKGNEFPLYVPFNVVISIFKDRVIATVECEYCGGKMNIDLKCSHGKSSDFTEDYIKRRILEVARRKHNCALKVSQWGDPVIAKKIAPDILRGYEKLKNIEERYRG